ncbi:MAG TPA: ABC transporter permease [Gemmatimonadaceae bacterium]|nr:ABC transporter permease [Gemmatimonadaceae bacterium]
MHTLIQDLRYAIRTLRKAPAFTLVCILTLAIGIGANTAIFSVINATFLKQLPFRDPDRLMLASLVIKGNRGGSVDTLPWSYPKFRTFLETQRSFGSVAGFTDENVILTGSGEPERLRIEVVSASYFGTLGINALIGRTFVADEDKTPGTHPVVVLSYPIWQRRFGGDSAVLGRTISLNKIPFTIVGVAPAGFDGLSRGIDMWVPMMMVPRLSYPEALEERWSHWFEVVARLRPGTSVEAARADIATAGDLVHQAHFPPFGVVKSTGTAVVAPLREARSDPMIRRSVTVLLGAVGFVLLIACANVANLFIARATGREREIGIRLALGAGRARLVRQLLTESMLLAMLGGLGGVLLALWTTDLLSALGPERTAAWGIRSSELLDLSALTVDGRVLAFALALSLLTGLLFGLLPALASTRPSLTEALKEGSSGISRSLGGRRRLTGRGALVAAEVAMALVLLIGAGLMLRSFALRQNVDLGFDPRNVLTLRVNPVEGDYTRRTAPEMHQRVMERLAALPGVVAVSVDKCTPLSSACNGSVVTQVDERKFAVDASGTAIGVHFIGPDHLRVLGVPLLRGRMFTLQDRQGMPRVVVINDAAARKWWPGQDPVGRNISVAIGYFADSTAEVIGVIGDVNYGSVESTAEPAVFIPNLQNSSPNTFFLIRTDGDPTALIPAVRREVLAVDPNLPVFAIRTMEERVGDALSRARFGSILLGVFAGIALLLASVGVYGVMAYAVSQRTHEMGVRIALGAERRDVIRLVLSQGAWLAALGIAVGLVTSAGLTRVLSGLLYGVSPTDPLTFIAISAALGTAALLATYIPARRATRVDPMQALRRE